MVDIALLRNYRRLGIGGRLLQRLIDEAEWERAKRMTTPSPTSCSTCASAWSAIFRSTPEAGNTRPIH